MADEQEKTQQTLQADETSTQTPAPDAKALETRMQELEKELNETKKGLQTAHRTLTEKDRQLKAAQETKDTLESLRMQMEVLKEYIPSRTPEADSEDEAPKRKPIDARLAEIETQSRYRQIGELATQAETIADSIDLDIESSPELKQVRRDFRKAHQAGDVKLARDALAKAMEIAEGIKAPKDAEKGKEVTVADNKVDLEAEKAKLREEIRREILKEYGNPEGGTPGSAGGLTAQQVKGMSPEELIARRKEIAKLPLNL